MAETKKHFYLCTVLSVSPVTNAIFRIDVEWPGPAPKAGQFFMLKPVHSEVFLPRPISVAFWDNSKKNTLGFLILKRGRGTKELSCLQSGHKIYLSGPLGNCWQVFLPAHGDKPIALVGGGIGIAPLLSLPSQLKNKNISIDFYAGFRTAFNDKAERDGLLSAVEPYVKNITIAVEDKGAETQTGICHGRILEFLNPAEYCAVYACGPEPMLKAVTDKCAASQTPCYISFERRMACGVGACLGCTVTTPQGNKRCCADGPIFRAESTDK